MFDIGFSELLVIAIVALLVLGPERLPKAARFAGLWLRRARAQWDSVKMELERDLAAEELRKGLHDTRAAIDDIGANIHSTGSAVEREFDRLHEQARDHLDNPDGDPMRRAQTDTTGDRDGGDDDHRDHIANSARTDTRSSNTARPAQQSVARRRSPSQTQAMAKTQDAQPDDAALAREHDDAPR